MKILLYPKLLARIELLNELTETGEIRQNRKALELITSLWVLHHTLWQVHYRTVVRPHTEHLLRQP